MKLLRWLLSLFRPTPAHVRGLFAYHDGHTRRLADPLELDGLFKKYGGDDWPDWLAVLHAVDRVPTSGNLAAQAAAQRDEAVRELVKLARKVFGLNEVTNDGRGLSGGECLGVLARYLAFLADLKERYFPLPNLPARPASSPTEQDTVELSPSTST